MSSFSPYALFPAKEEWGTGDEAMDNKLSIALKKVTDNLSVDAISEFYFYGLTLRPRAYNPAFHVTIELVTKALLSLQSPSSFIDHQMLKLKGNYHSKKIVPFNFSEKEKVLRELKEKKICRYKGQIDFYLSLKVAEERNPFVQYSLVRAPFDFHIKILMKDFRSYLSGELSGDKFDKVYDDAFFQALRSIDQILLIDHFGEFWYHEGQIFSLPHFEL
jgi:hypothetical protein